MSSGSERADLKTALRGLDFPAPRNKLVEKAKENGASREVILQLLALPESADFQNPQALKDVLGIELPEERPHGWE